MFQRMLASALIAGLVAGLLAALLHFAFVQQLIVLGEQYETGAVVHFGGLGSTEFGPAHADSALPVAGSPDTAPPDTATADAPAVALAAPEHPEGPAASALKRNALSVVFMAIVHVAYAFLLVAGFGLAEAFGHKIGARDGLLWGIAGFASFQLGPAMGLAPELPGTIAADLSLRQIWWWMTVACTGSGLALLAYGRHWAAAGLGAVFVALPHLIGAPLAEGFAGLAPTELAAMFSARVLGSAFVVWAGLGWVAGTVWAREARPA